MFKSRSKNVIIWPELNQYRSLRIPAFVYMFEKDFSYNIRPSTRLS